MTNLGVDDKTTSSIYKDVFRRFERMPFPRNVDVLLVSFLDSCIIYPGTSLPTLHGTEHFESYMYKMCPSLKPMMTVCIRGRKHQMYKLTFFLHLDLVCLKSEIICS